jgi:hypothetical protein
VSGQGTLETACYSKHTVGCMWTKVKTKSCHEGRVHVEIMLCIFQTSSIR